MVDGHLGFSSSGFVCIRTHVHVALFFFCIMLRIPIRFSTGEKGPAAWDKLKTTKPADLELHQQPTNHDTTLLHYNPATSKQSHLLSYPPPSPPGFYHTIPTMSGLPSKWSTDTTLQVTANKQDQLAQQQRKEKTQVSTKGKPLASRWATDDDEDEEKKASPVNPHFNRNVSGPERSSPRNETIGDPESDKFVATRSRSRNKPSSSRGRQFGNTNSLAARLGGNDDQHVRSPDRLTNNPLSHQRARSRITTPDDYSSDSEEEKTLSESESDSEDDGDDVEKREVEFQREAPTEAGNSLARRLGLSTPAEKPKPAAKEEKKTVSPKRERRLSSPRRERGSSRPKQEKNPETEQNSGSLFDRIGSPTGNQVEENKRMVENLANGLNRENYNALTRERITSDSEHHSRRKNVTGRENVKKHETLPHSPLSRAQTSPLHLTKAYKEDRKGKGLERMKQKEEADRLYEEEQERLLDQAEKDLQELLTKKFDWAEEF